MQTINTCNMYSAAEAAAFDPEPLPRRAQGRDAEGDGAGKQGFVLCESAGLLLAIPSHDVVAIEHGQELRPPLGHERVLGWFDTATANPVYALDGALELTRSADRAPALIVLLRHASAPVGLACETARMLTDDESLSVEPLAGPFAKAVSERPVVGLARLDAERLALVCESGALADYLTSGPRDADAAP